MELTIRDWKKSYAEGSDSVPDSNLNMPEALDEELLRLQPEDFVGPDAIPKDLKEMEVKPASVVAEGDEIATKLVRAVKERITVK
jgi:hypothetical protein